MTDREWAGIELVLDNAFKGEMGDTKSGVYRSLLMDYSERDVQDALRALVSRGLAFIPSPGEIMAEIAARNNGIVPGWSEVWAELSRTLRLPRERCLEDLYDLHPHVAAFLEVEGYEKLRLEPFYDPDYGALRIRDLERRWTEFKEVAAHREASGQPLIGGPRREEGPQRISFTDALGIDPPREVE